MDFPAVAERVGPETLLMGNIDPVQMLTAGPQAIAQQAETLLDGMAPWPMFALSTGCDLPQDVPMHNISALMDTGRAWRVPVPETAVAAG